MKKILNSISLFVLLLCCISVSAQSGIVLPNGIKVPEVSDLKDVVSPFEGMIVYSEQQKGLYFRKESSWEMMSEAVLSSDAHVFVKIDGVTPDLYDESFAAGLHSSESKILEIDFNITRKLGTARTLGALSASFKYRKKLGASSLEISKGILQAKSYPEVIFTFYVRDESNLRDIPYYRYTMDNVKFLSNQLLGPHPELNTLLQNQPNRSVKSIVQEIELVFDQILIEDLISNSSFTYTFPD